MDGQPRSERRGGVEPGDAVLSPIHPLSCHLRLSTRRRQIAGNGYVIAAFHFDQQGSRTTGGSAPTPNVCVITNWSGAIVVGSILQCGQRAPMRHRARRRRRAHSRYFAISSKLSTLLPLASDGWRRCWRAHWGADEGARSAVGDRIKPPLAWNAARSVLSASCSA